MKLYNYNHFAEVMGRKGQRGGEILNIIRQGKWGVDREGKARDGSEELIRFPLFIFGTPPYLRN